MTKNGILCEVDEKRVFLDPKNSDVSGVNFVSHAHTDHLPSKNGGTILSSIEISLFGICVKEIDLWFRLF